MPIFILENWSFRSTIKLIRDELLPKIGEVVGFTYNGTGPYAAHKYINTGWRVKPVHIGGYLSDGGVHQLALLTGVLGDVESISALTRQIRETSGTVDTLFSTLKLDSGAIGTFTYGSQFGATKKNTFFTIFGTDGSITYDFSPNLPKPTVTYQTLSAPEPTVIEIDEIDTFVAEFENVIETVRSGKKEGVHVKPAEAFHHLAVIAAALESAEHNGTSVKVEKV